MKKEGLSILLFLVLVCTSLFAQNSEFHLYYQDDKNGMLRVHVYTDKNNDAVCDVFPGMNTFYLCQGRSGDFYSYVGFAYQPEYRMVSIVPGVLPMPTLTGNIIKVTNQARLWLAVDYSKVIVGDKTYSGRISKDTYDRIYENIRRGANMLAPSSPNNGGTYNQTPQQNLPSRHGDTRCNSCNGTGRCSMCKGKGSYLYNGNYYSCDSCHGSCRCKVCHGKGSIHY